MILAILTYCLGDVLLKIGNIEIESTLPSILKGGFWVAFFTNLPIISAFVFALISKLIMGFILSRNPLGITEGIFLALTAIFSFILGVLIFNENITTTDGVAICFIAIGIFIAYSDVESENLSKKGS
jgi:multidrug transporter EmrE-like cation transporter